MYLDNLSIHGFKSFAKKTKLQFKDGITTIVGPNGCGKSNVVDAIRWVLGEQKAGSVRSEKMENVIFNGSKTMKPLGMSEVSMTIHNTKNVLPVEYSEVVITRRLFRSLESQYLLNNTPCRLKDIQDLFMDTGMGSNAYSIIELGMVEALLNGKPEERRRIFEEAAGVTKYKLRRKAAFRKLEATETDLLRVHDIISEVEKSVSSLQRQVKKAKRFQEFQLELREKEIQLSTHLYSKIRMELEPLRVSLRASQDNRVQLTARFDEKESQIEESRRQLLDLERNLSTEQKELNQLALQIQKKEEQILVDRERRKALEDKKARLLRDKQELSAKQQKNDVEIKKAADELQALFDEIRVAEGDFQKKDADLQKMDLRIQEKNEQIKSIENQRLRAIEGLTDSKKEEERIKTQLENIRDRVQAIDRQLEENELLTKLRDDKIDKLQEKKVEQDGKVRRLQDELKNVQNQLESLTAKKEMLKENVLRRNGELQTLKERIDLLKKFIESHEDHPEGVQHLLQAGHLNGECKGTLAENLKVRKEYRRALEIALGEAAVSLIVEETDHALRCIEVLKTEEKGNVTFFPLDRFSNGSARRTDRGNIARSEGVIDWANKLVECSDVYRPMVDSLLGDYLIVQDLKTARHHVKDLGRAGVNLITLNGEVFANSGFIKGGANGGTDSSIIGRKAQVEELQGRLEQTFATLTEDQANQKKVEELYHQVFGQQQEMSRDLKRQEEHLTSIEVQLAQLNFEAKRENEAKDKLAKEKQEQLAQGEALHAHSATIAPNLSGLEQNRQRFEVEHKKLGEELTSLQEEIKVFRDKAQESRMVLVDLKGEERHLQENSGRLNEYHKELKQTFERTTEEIEAATTEYVELEKRIELNKKAIEVDFEEHRKLEAEVQKLEEQYGAEKEVLESKEKEVRAIRDRRDEVSEAFHAMELRVSELEMKGDKIKDRIKEEYEFEVRKGAVDEELDVERLSDDIQDIKNRLNSMGPVNMLALREYEKEKERFDFLQAQRDDLRDAEKNLNETIKVINKTAREQFLNTFEDIRKNFVKVFTGFFENGIANLRLDAHDDPLEAEIVIEADPKGRRISALTLLSGGEKTLTAISILFAIYLVKPSPFCILDEVDAPLDDANIGRFVNAIRKFSNNTQFIIVTHNKLTMQASDCLYGITMEQEGISKVVSVNFEEMELN